MAKRYRPSVRRGSGRYGSAANYKAQNLCQEYRRDMHYS